ncbi:MAG: hydroxyacid dehydrogenase [Rariglobus sp.]|jgi:phosphoglycerate dehydrogenase-like enzyme|nr:hydroxyacid dehydrogenase [Rariglobus sp.]
MDTLATPAASSGRKATHSTERVLFAINAQERGDFFPNNVIDLDDIEVRWCPATASLTPVAWLALLEEFQPTVIVSCWSTPAIPPAFAEAGSALRYVCHLAGSARSLVSRAFLERGGLLTNWGALAGDTVAEHALLLALAALRRQPAWQQIITGPRAIPWRNSTVRLQTRTLIGRRVGVHGFGHVARSLIRLLQPFNVRICAFSSGVPSALMENAGVTPCQSLAELAARSEVFFECEALTPHNIASINTPVLAALPDDAVFVNVGRGLLVDEPALLREAQSGRIQVALDVVAKEPLGPESPAVVTPNALLSPHIGGPTYDRLPACGRLALDNLDRYLRGEPLEALITPELYDRST